MEAKGQVEISTFLVYNWKKTGCFPEMNGMVLLFYRVEWYGLTMQSVWRRGFRISLWSARLRRLQGKDLIERSVVYVLSILFYFMFVILVFCPGTTELYN